MTLPAEVSELLIPINPDLETPLHRQIYHGLRDAILSGRLAAGLRIPSTRLLATSLGVSRSTILIAFEQLTADGFIVGTAFKADGRIGNPVDPNRVKDFVATLNR